MGDVSSVGRGKDSTDIVQPAGQGSGTRPLPRPLGHPGSLLGDTRHMLGRVGTAVADQEPGDIMGDLSGQGYPVRQRSENRMQ